MDKYGKALCRNHQNIETNNNNIIEKDDDFVEEEYVEDVDVVLEDDDINQSGGWKSFVKKVAVATGKGIVKGTKAVASTTKKTMQERAWKDKILRRMSGNKIKQLAREKRVSPAFIEKPKVDDYIGAIKNRVRLDEIIAFAKRNKVNVRDILTEIEQVKANNELLQMKKEGKDIDEFYLEVLETIHNFKPFERYKKELAYQIDLARWLQNKFPNTKIEETRGSTRPDIVIKGIAIEVKGPTNDGDLRFCVKL